jgi:hypothetical protein
MLIDYSSKWQQNQQKMRQKATQFIVAQIVTIILVKNQIILDIFLR